MFIHQVLDVYDCNLGMLRIGPFNYEPLRSVELWLAQTDDIILQHLSTTPEVEPPHFVMQVKNTLFSQITHIKLILFLYFRSEQRLNISKIISSLP